MMRHVKEMRYVYRDFLKTANKINSKVTVLEADLSSSMATNGLAKEFGNRYINVGIMEAEMVGLAAGLAVKGYKPYLHTFGPFASRRVFDQLFVSLAYAKLNATVIGSDAGVTAEMNGGTHMPFEEIGLMRLVPNAVVYDVCDDIQFDAVLKQTLTSKAFHYIRTTRKAPKAVYNGDEDFSKGYVQLRQGPEATIVASGIMVAEALEVADKLAKEGLEVGVIDLFRIKPIHEDIKGLLVGKPVLTVENHNKIGGVGSAICELLSQETDTPVRRMGVDERFGQVGKMDYLLEVYELTQDHIYHNIKEFLKDYH